MPEKVSRISLWNVRECIKKTHGETWKIQGKLTITCPTNIEILHCKTPNRISWKLFVIRANRLLNLWLLWPSVLSRRNELTVYPSKYWNGYSPAVNDKQAVGIRTCLPVRWNSLRDALAFRQMTDTNPIPETLSCFWVANEVQKPSNSWQIF